MRFLSADILTGKSGNTQSLNKYAYCEGDPVNYTDPFGTSPEIRAKKKYNRISKTSHGALDVAGMIPVFGIVFDSVNTVWYLVDLVINDYNEEL